MLEQLHIEVCFGELAKRAVRWAKHHSNITAVTALEMEELASKKHTFTLVISADISNLN